MCADAEKYGVGRAIIVTGSHEQMLVIIPADTMTFQDGDHLAAVEALIESIDGVGNAEVTDRQIVVKFSGRRQLTGQVYRATLDALQLAGVLPNCLTWPDYEVMDEEQWKAELAFAG